MLYTIATCISCSSFHVSLFFNQQQLKADVANQGIHSCPCKRSTVGQLIVQVATAEKGK